MDPKRRFYALEVMCRERAAVARKDLEYWLAEAEEWAHLRRSGCPSLAVAQTNRGDSEPTSK
jgi:hypothetical protein